MVQHGGSSAGLYLADPTFPIPSHSAVIILFKRCLNASTVVTSTLGVKILMVGHGWSSARSYLADPTSPIPSHCAVIILLKKCLSASIVMTSTLGVKGTFSSFVLSSYEPMHSTQSMRKFRSCSRWMYNVKVIINSFSSSTDYIRTQLNEVYQKMWAWFWVEVQCQSDFEFIKSL